MSTDLSFVLIRGGGDLASGVAVRLHRVGLNVLITELPQPLALRRLVSFAEAVYRGKIVIEGVTARRVQNTTEARDCIVQREIPVLIDPSCEMVLGPGDSCLEPLSLIDARMTKQEPGLTMEMAPLVIGLGPGFIAGENCQAAIETNRGHFLGRVIWEGTPEADTGVPGTISQHRDDRVLRAPAQGVFYARVDIGSQVKKGQIIAEVFGKPIAAPFAGVLRGLLHDGLVVHQGFKVGDLDPRDDPRYASLISEKSLAIGGGVLEALLTRPEIRARLWN